MMGCGPGKSCCGSCRAKVTVLSAPLALNSAPQNNGSVGMGFFPELIALATTAVSYAPEVAQVAATVNSLSPKANGGTIVPQATADQIAAQIVAQQQQNNSLSGVLKSPLALAGIGAVVVALILKR